MEAHSSRESTESEHLVKEDDQQVRLHLDPKEDDLDMDAVATPNRGKPKPDRGISPSKHKAKARSRSRSRSSSTRSNMAVTSTKKKPRQTVAHRLNLINSPESGWVTENPNNSSFNAEKERMDREMKEAQLELRKTQWEAEKARKQLEAEEVRRKTLTLQKQAEKDRKKAAQEKARYEREIKKMGKTPKKKASGGDRSNKIKIATTSHRHAEVGGDEHYIPREWDEFVTHNLSHPPEDSNDGMNEYLAQYRSKVKELNPLRRARKLFSGYDGSNNPNIEGQDNGYNAWMDTQVNPQDMDEAIRNDARYAKRNSERSGFQDIDDIPVRGLPKLTDINSDVSIDEIACTANELMDDDNVSVCRITGIMKVKDDHREEHKRRPASTVTRVHQNRDDGNSNRWRSRSNNRLDGNTEKYRYNEQNERDGLGHR